MSERSRESQSGDRSPRYRRWLLGVTLAAVIGFAGTLSLQAKQGAAGYTDQYYKEAELFEDALDKVRTNYVEEPQAQQLIYGALKGMLATLDPYSQFLDPDSYSELKIDTEGQFGGLGIEITIKDDLLTIITPIDDTPAFHAGLKSQDRIVKIDHELTRGITLMEAVKKLRGKPGTSVILTVLREGEAELKDVTIERAMIKIQSVRSDLFEDHIGYIRVSDFREKTTEDLESAIQRLKEQAMDSLILDLRNNPGGLLDQAVSVSELFLRQRQLVVMTKGRLRNQNLEFHARRDGSVNGVPLVVLINEGSASASEIVAGAIQDHRRGIVMGTKSHGKASVQTIFPLKDGSALRLTTSKYFTPNGRLIHGQGILPDVTVPLEKRAEEASDTPKSQAAEEIFDRLQTSQTPADQSADSKPAEKKPMDNQLARAVDLLKGIKVYQTHEQSPNAS